MIAADGTLTAHDRDLDLRSEVGPEGPARVRLATSVLAAGWTNDDGHAQGYPRNTVGSCVLLSRARRRRPPLRGSGGPHRLGPDP